MARSTSLGLTEQRTLRGLGAWALADLIVRPDDWTSPTGGYSHFKGLGQENDWLDYSPKGIKVKRRLPEDQWVRDEHGNLLAFEEVVSEVKWPKVKRWLAANVDDDLRQRIAEVLKRRREHQRAYKVFAASKEAVGCGPIPADESQRTEAQALYVTEHQRWLAEHHRPHMEKREQIEAELGALLDEALPLVKAETTTTVAIGEDGQMVLFESVVGEGSD